MSQTSLGKHQRHMRVLAISGTFILPWVLDSLDVGADVFEVGPAPA
jgi:hypothetical protein